MDVDLRIPATGNAVDEVYLVEWLVSENELIDEGQDLFSVESDKSTIVVPAPVGGRVTIMSAAGSAYLPGHIVAKINVSSL